MQLRMTAAAQLPYRFCQFVEALRSRLWPECLGCADDDAAVSSTLATSFSSVDALNRHCLR